MNSYNILFPTPIWHFKNLSLPEGAYEWALDYKEKNLPGVEKSNRGGYQSTINNPNEFEYKEHITNILRGGEFKKFKVTSWWLNINKKGDYNLPHTHPGIDLACVWYITDNEGLLYLEDPLVNTRVKLNYILKQDSEGRLSRKRIFASAGDLLIFPGDIVHNVEEHVLDTPRISVSFNMVL